MARVVQKIKCNICEHYLYTVQLHSSTFINRKILLEANELCDKQLTYRTIANFPTSIYLTNSTKPGGRKIGLREGGDGWWWWWRSRSAKSGAKIAKHTHHCQQLRGATFVLHLRHISTTYSMLKLLNTPTIANNCVCNYVAPHLY